MHNDTQMKLQILPTKPELESQIKNFNSMERFIYYMVTKIDGNLFSFLSGAVATIPITAIFNIVTIEINKTVSCIAIIIIYFLAFFISCAMSVEVFKFTIKHMEINNYAKNENNIEIYINKLVAKTIENKKELFRSFVLFCIFTFIFVVLIISIFVINCCG